MRYITLALLFLLFLSSCGKNESDDIVDLPSLGDLIGSYDIELERQSESDYGPSEVTYKDSKLTIYQAYDDRFLIQTKNLEIDYYVGEVQRTDSLVSYSTLTPGYTLLSLKYFLVERRLVGSSLEPGNGPGTNYYFDFILPE